MVVRSTRNKITAASAQAEREKKSKLNSEQFTVGSKNWVQCPICSGFFASTKWSLKVGNGKIHVCAWCFSRGGKYLALFIQFVEAFANRPCEVDDMDRVPENGKCKCAPCTARALIAYRTQVVGEQIAPINTQLSTNASR